MAYLGNSPAREIVLRLEARKSFALAIFIKDRLGNALDITGVTLRLVVKPSLDGLLNHADTDNLIGNSTAEIVAAEAGYARLNLQGSDLAWEPGEYPFSLVMVETGYSQVIVRGVIDLVQNTEFASVAQSYYGIAPDNALEVLLRGRNVLEVSVGPNLAPGSRIFTDSDKTKLDELVSPSSAELVPTDGTTGQLLQKTPGGSVWAYVPVGTGSPLPATDATAGYVPTANGSGGWAWAMPPVLTLAQATKLDSLTRDYTQLDNLPTLGTAAAHAATDFRSAGAVAAADITGVLDITHLPKASALIPSGTAAPTGGADGDMYLQYS